MNDLLDISSDTYFMSQALRQARKAEIQNEVPIGAVIVRRQEIIARSWNQVETLKDATAHAEMLAIQAAAGHLGRWRLQDVTLYSTVEPCTMCAGALVAARVFRVVYGAPDEKAGAAYSLYNILQDPRLNHECRLTTGVLAEDCAAVIQEFFRARRGRVESL